MKKHTPKLHRPGHRQYLGPLLFVGGFAITGSLLLLIGFAAAPDDPIGFADSCYLDGATTVVRGWGHDNSSGAGPNPTVQVTMAGKTVTASTSIANYRQSDIDAALTSNGYTPTTIYGFEARFTGLYKGAKPVISGTVFNLGPGANQPLGINTFNQSAASSGSVIFLGGNVVPDYCLASPPGPAPTPPTPTPTTSKPKPTSTAKKPTPSPSPTPPSPTPPATPPAQQAPTTYVITISFFNNSAEVTDVKAALSELNLTASTDKNNQVIFQDVPAGTYTVNFAYQGKAYSYTLEVPASQPGQATTSADGKTLSYTIDLARLLPTSEPQQTTNTPPPTQKSSRGGRLTTLFTGFIFIVVALVATIIFGRRYRSRKNSSQNDALSTSYQLPAATPLPPNSPPPHDPNLHTGVSLKQMVIESMRKEAANRQRNNDPKQ